MRWLRYVLRAADMARAILEAAPIVRDVYQILSDAERAGTDAVIPAGAVRPTRLAFRPLKEIADELPALP